MRSLTFCAICLLAVAAGLAVYEALNAWVGVKARGLMLAWARSDQAGGSSRGRAHAGAARLWSRAVEALAGFAPLSMRERERSRERLSLIHICGGECGCGGRCGSAGGPGHCLPAVAPR